MMSKEYHISLGEGVTKTLGDLEVTLAYRWKEPAWYRNIDRKTKGVQKQEEVKSGIFLYSGIGTHLDFKERAQRFLWLDS
jgi:hypothetical protein